MKRIFSILIVLSNVVWTQESKRCDWHSEKTSADAKYVGCLDVSGYHGKSFQLPANVTRIGEDGLAVCLNTILNGGSADIVYLMDRSSSMSAPAACLDNGDTLFTERHPKSSVVGEADFVYMDGTRRLPVYSSCSGGGVYAGDPYGQRALIIKEAIKLQQQLSLKATTGFAAFNSAPITYLDQPPLEISKDYSDAQTNIETLFPKIYIQNSSELPLSKQNALAKTAATGWAGSIGQAKLWLTPENGHTRTENQAIVLVSDGRPADWFAVEAVLEPNSVFYPGKMPPVYGIHLGNTDPGDPIKDIATLTGGKWFMVPPEDPDSLRRVMSQIIGTILKSHEPKSAVLRNKGSSVQATSKSFESQTGGNWGVRLVHPVALDTGKNNLEFVATFHDPASGMDTSYTVEFELDVSGPAATENGLSHKCYDPARLEALADAGKPLGYLNRASGNFDLRLTLDTAAGVPGATQDVSATTTQSGDNEILTLAAAPSAGRFQSEVPFSPTTSAPGKGDGTLQSAFEDEARFSWSHPHDPRDRANLNLEIRDPRATAEAAAYFDDDADGHLDRFEIEFGTDVAPNKAVIASHPEIFRLPGDLKLDRLEWQETKLVLHVARHTSFAEGPLPLVIASEPQVKDEGFVDPVELDAKDKMAPVLVAARFLPNSGKEWKPGNDTLEVTYSETAKTALPKPYHLVQGGKSGYAFSLESLGGSGKTVRFRVTGIDGVRQPRQGDSIWIAVGKVEDALGNVQNNESNRRVLLEVGRFPVSATARYIDGDADGLLDAFVIDWQLPAEPDAGQREALAQALTLPDGFAPSEKTWAGTTLTIRVESHGLFRHGPLNLRNPDREGVAGLRLPGEISARDAVAPVIISAEFIPERPANGELRSGGADTLVVSFSEPTEVLSDTPFQLTTKREGKEYHFRLELQKSEGKEARFQVTAIEGILYPNTGDPIWVRAGGARDEHGNTQEIAPNGKATLKARPSPSRQDMRVIAPLARSPENSEEFGSVGFAIVATGSGPGTGAIRTLEGDALPGLEPSELQKGSGEEALYRKTGMVIEASRPFDLYLRVYDNLGGFVRTVGLEVPEEAFLDLPEGRAPGTRALTLAWDGTAQGGQEVGTGVYIFKATVTLKAMEKNSRETVTGLFLVGLTRE